MVDLTQTLHDIQLGAANLALLFLAINVVLCLFNFKKLNRPLKVFFFIILLNFSTEVLAILFTKFLEINNLPLLHIYTLLEFILFSLFYKSLIAKPISIQKKFWPIILGGSLLILFNSICIQSIFAFNSYAKTFVQICIIGYAVIYFYNYDQNKILSESIAKSLRLINSAILIYYSGSLFIFMFSQFSLEKIEAYALFWSFNAVLYLIFQLFIFWGLWKIFYKKIPLSS